MDNTRKPETNKPLNCLYCLNAVLTPGSSKTAYFEATRPTPNCFCYDVPHELFDLYLLRIPDNEIDIYAWLPYHCGHFMPRMLQLRCRNCGRPEQFEEWDCLKDIFIKGYREMTCNTVCHTIYMLKVRS